ncbi:hypothetical protein MAE30S32_39310 [Microcystis aeruginosa 11-30S32]|uniref:Uncharacterized protein n=1 Tax=Microcystis aeruginosa 11-30S32 TaxID=2358142 RepID=A0A510PNK5_MICAE|nr:hypothetical protein MAE30S32_39310 [Microcystis aeruginosa 11-30S32]
MIIQKLQRHDFGIPGHPRHAYPIISFASNSSSNMGSVTINITWVIVVIGKVPTANVVNVAIAIVVNAVVGNLPWVCPDITGQIGMVVVNPRINNPNH